MPGHEGCDAALQPSRGVFTPLQLFTQVHSLVCHAQGNECHFAHGADDLRLKPGRAKTEVLPSAGSM